MKKLFEFSQTCRLLLKIRRVWLRKEFLCIALLALTKYLRGCSDKTLLQLNRQCKPLYLCLRRERPHCAQRLQKMYFLEKQLLIRVRFLTAFFMKIFWANFVQSAVKIVAEFTDNIFADFVFAFACTCKEYCRSH